MPYPYDAIPEIATTGGKIAQSNVVLTASNNAYVYDYPQNLSVISTRRFASELIAAGVNNEITVLTLMSGSYITMSYTSIDTDSVGTYIRGVTTKFYKSDHTLAFTMGGGAYNNYLTGVPSGYAVLCFAYVVYDIDGVYKVAGMNLLMRDNDSLPWPASVDYLIDASDWFHDSDIPPEYVWTAWDQIAGNGGQYRCDLTKIKVGSIGDFSAIQTGDLTDFDRISSQSSIWNIFHNMGFNETRKIAWSGGNYITMRLNEEPEYPSQYTFTFSFYNIVTVGGEQTPSLIWQDTFPITWTGDPRDTDFYLSFIYDAEQEIAVFLPVTKDTTGSYEWGWSGGLPTDTTMHNLWVWLQGSQNPEVVTPYTQGTEDNGGTPGGSIPQSHIDVPTAPALGAMTSGMFTLYCPDDTELQHISQFLWSDGFISNIKKYFNNVSDNIMALYVLPYKPSNNPVKAFQVGNMVSDDSALSAVEYIDDRFVTIDMGDVKIKPFWGSYLDYAPYSSLQVVLPGVGVQTLDVDDIFCPADENGDLPAPSEATIHIDYTIDLMTGVLVAFISINGEMRYQFPGKLGYQIPLTGENYVRMAQGFVTAAAGLIGTIASAGAAAPFTAPAATAGIINAMKPDVYRGGNLSGDASMLARLTPTLIYRRPNKPLLPDQGEFTGFPSYKIGNLSEFSGYTEVLDAHVEGISCTDEERVLILEALKEGVII